MPRFTGVVRRLDGLGRIVIPMELRRILDWHSGIEVEFTVDGQNVILAPHTPGCIFCGSMDDLIEYRERRICGDCVRDLGDERQRTPARVPTRPGPNRHRRETG